MDKPNGANGDTREQVTVVTLAYNHTTCQVSLGIHDVGIALAQMMLDEARRQLDIMRRQAAALELRKQVEQAQADAALRAALAGKNPTHR